MAKDKLTCLQHEMDTYLSNEQKFTPELKNRIRNAVEDLEQKHGASKQSFILPKVMTAALSLVVVFSIGWFIYDSNSTGMISGDDGKEGPSVVTDDKENDENIPDTPAPSEKHEDKEKFYLEGVYLGDTFDEVNATYGEPEEIFIDEKTGIETLKFTVQNDPLVRLHISFLRDKVVGLSMYYNGPIHEEGVYNKNRYIWEFGEPDESREVSCYHTATCEEIVYKTDTAEKVVRFSWEGNLEFVTIKNIEAYRSSLSKEEILSLILQGHEHFWYAFLGGNDTEHTTFKYNDWEVEFDYFGEDLDTREKMIDYLDDVYSQRMIDFLFMKYDWIQHNGKLARPQAGLASLTSWKDMKFIRIEREPTNIVITAEIPLGDTGQVIEEEVILTFTEQKGWLLDTEIR